MNNLPLRPPEGMGVGYVRYAIARHNYYIQQHSILPFGNTEYTIDKCLGENVWATVTNTEALDPTKKQTFKRQFKRHTLQAVFDAYFPNGINNVTLGDFTQPNIDYIWNSILADYNIGFTDTEKASLEVDFDRNAIAITADIGSGRWYGRGVIHFPQEVFEENVLG